MRQTPHDLRLHEVEIRDGEGMRILGPTGERAQRLTAGRTSAAGAGRGALMGRRYSQSSSPQYSLAVLAILLLTLSGRA
ncbi:MAG: hypothetical protein GSR80_000410, partial [Desulfurococcales archaeon]|nr:hypothetical protein [Desulfurococcales archaeon]